MTSECHSRISTTEKILLSIFHLNGHSLGFHIIIIIIIIIIMSQYET